MLRGAIRLDVTIPGKPRSAGDVHNASPAVPKHGGQSLMYAVEGAVEIYLHHIAPQREVRFGERRRNSLTCVVHQNLNRTEARARCFKRAMEFFRLADIRLCVMKTPLVSHVCRRLSTAAKHGYVRAMRNQGPAHGRANTTRATRNHGVLASQCL